MAAINVQVNGRPYVVGCDDGEEEHVAALARQFDRQVQAVADQVGAVGELRLFLLAALTTADDLNDARARLDQLQAGEPRAPTAAPVAEEAEVDGARFEAEAAALVEDAAARLEALAARL